MLRRGDRDAARGACGSARAHVVRGFTLVELLVVMTIFVILAALAIPSIARLGVFSRNELQRTAQELHMLLQAAKVYAVQNHVNTAVVYRIDSGLDPITDTVTGQQMRVLRAAAMLYEWHGQFYVPVNRREGIFSDFPGGMVVFLWDPLGRPYFYDPEPGFNQCACGGGACPPDHVDRLAELGMQKVRVNVGAVEEGIPGVASECMPAHVFTPMSRLGSATGKERYRIQVGPPPNFPPDARLLNPNLVQVTVPDEHGNPVSNLTSIPMELYASTGRVKVVS